MADATYGPKVYRDSSGDRINVISGGTLNVEAGATETHANTATFSGTLAVTGTLTSGAGAVIVPDTLFVTYLQPVGTAAATWAVTTPFFTFPNDGHTYKCTAASVRYTTASTSGVVTITLDASATAPGAGTTQFTGVNTSAVANTVLNMTAPVGTVSAAGGALSAVWSGTVTGLVGCVITVAIQRVS